MIPSIINIDFSVTSDLFSIEILDKSSWGVIETQPAIIEVLLPGSRSVKPFFFNKKEVTYFNANHLLQDCPDCDSSNLKPLPDGIYIITMKGSPDTFFKEVKYLKTDRLKLDISRLYLDSIQKESPFKKDFADKMNEIMFYLDGAEAALRWDDEYEANKAYNMAKKKSDKLRDCKHC